jgi:nucleotide-binding universal stress UspA family protein
MDINVHTPALVAIGVDGSPHCEAALVWAAGEARAHRRRLYVFHCWQPAALFTAATPMLPPPNMWQDERDRAQAVLDEATGSLGERFPEIPLTARLLEGPSGRELAAQLRRDDLLVLGMTSRHRLTARMLGSTIEYALRRVRGTVVVVPADHRGNGTGPFARHVVAAVDGSEAASAVLGAAFAEAAAHGWPLAVVHADPHGRNPNGSVPGELWLANHPWLLRVIGSWQARYPQVAVHKATFNGRPAVVTDHVAAGAQLLVVGRPSHPTRPMRLIDHVLAKVNCPVAVIPPTVAVRETQIVGRLATTLQPV